MERYTLWNLHARFLRLAWGVRFLRKIGVYKPTSINTSYIICATPRSGSTLLCEALRNTSVAGRPAEYFSNEAIPNFYKQWKVSSYTDYFDKVLEKGTTFNGVFGAKMMLDHYAQFKSQVRQIPRYKDCDTSPREFLSELFPNLHYIWIIRRDKVRQAVSFEKALQTGIFESRINKALSPQEQSTFSFKTINSRYYLFLAQEIIWQEYFDSWGVTPFKVVYEDFVDNYEQIIKDILNYLKLPIPDELGTDKRELLKVADALSEEWVKLYYEIKGRCT